jgi:hypothetical protein
MNGFQSDLNLAYKPCAASAVLSVYGFVPASTETCHLQTERHRGEAAFYTVEASERFSMDWHTLLIQHSRLLLSLGFGAVSLIVFAIAGVAFFRRADKPLSLGPTSVSVLGRVIPITHAQVVRCIHCGTKMLPRQRVCMRCGDVHPLRPTGTMERRPQQMSGHL